MDRNTFKEQRDSLIQKINILEAEYKAVAKDLEERTACLKTIAKLRKELTKVQCQVTGAMSLHRQHGQLISNSQKLVKEKKSSALFKIYSSNYLKKTAIYFFSFSLNFISLH